MRPPFPSPSSNSHKTRSIAHKKRLIASSTTSIQNNEWQVLFNDCINAIGCAFGKPLLYQETESFGSTINCKPSSDSSEIPDYFFLPLFTCFLLPFACCFVASRIQISPIGSPCSATHFHSPMPCSAPARLTPRPPPPMMRFPGR